METTHNAINWFEIPVSDFAMAKKFYSTIFDYEMPEMMMGPHQMGFLVFDQENRGIGGAIVKGDGYIPSSSGSRVYLNAGKDLSTVLGRVEAAGGKVIVEKTMVAPDMGYWATFEDCEGNFICLHSEN